MDHKEVKDYLLGKPEASENYPFGPDVAVFKVKDKMFATFALGSGHEKGTAGKMAGFYCMNLKCDPAHADALRSIFPSVIPGYHMSKTHWNTIILDNSIPSCEIKRMIDHSYSLVVRSLKKSLREHLELIHSKEALYPD